LNEILSRDGLECSGVYRSKPKHFSTCLLEEVDAASRRRQPGGRWALRARLDVLTKFCVIYCAVRCMREDLDAQFVEHINFSVPVSRPLRRAVSGGRGGDHLPSLNRTRRSTENHRLRQCYGEVLQRDVNDLSSFGLTTCSGPQSLRSEGLNHDFEYVPHRR
jgi:hypothetical protein